MTDADVPEPQPPANSRPTGGLRGLQFSLAGVFVLLTTMAVMLSIYMSVGQWLGMSGAEIAPHMLSLLLAMPILLVWSAGVLLAIRRPYPQPRVARLALIAFSGLILTRLLWPFFNMVLLRAVTSGLLSSSRMQLASSALTFFHALLDATWWILIVRALFGQRLPDAPEAYRGVGDNPFRQSEAELPGMGKR